MYRFVHQSAIFQQLLASGHVFGTMGAPDHTRGSKPMLVGKISDKNLHLFKEILGLVAFRFRCPSVIS